MIRADGIESKKKNVKGNKGTLLDPLQLCKIKSTVICAAADFLLYMAPFFRAIKLEV